MKNENRLRSLHTFAHPSTTAFSDADDSPTISGYIRRAASDVAPENSSTPAPAPRSQLQPEILLGVLSYCYASGVYDSAEIENRLWEDHTFRARFDQQLPTAPRIRQFRRRHRPQLLSIITSALRARRSSAQAVDPSIHEPAAAAVAALENAALADSLNEP